MKFSLFLLELLIPVIYPIGLYKIYVSLYMHLPEEL